MDYYILIILATHERPQVGRGGVRVGAPWKIPPLPPNFLHVESLFYPDGGLLLLMGVYSPYRGLFSPCGEFLFVLWGPFFNLWGLFSSYGERALLGLARPITNILRVTVRLP